MKTKTTKRLTKAEQEVIEGRIGDAAYDAIPGGLRGRWFIYVFEKADLWSVDSTNFRNPKCPLRFAKLLGADREEALARFIRTLKTQYKERRIVKHQIEVAAYGQIPGNTSMCLTAYRDQGKWIVLDHVSGATWAVIRRAHPGTRSAFSFRKVFKGDED